MNQVIRYEDSARAIKALARKVLRRCHAAGARSVMIEDIEGELNIAWCIARDKFDPSQGVPFGAYLNRGMLNHINRWVQGQTDQTNLAPYSLDVPVSIKSNNARDNETSLGEITADPNAVKIDEEVERKDLRGWILDRLSEEARVVIAMIENPPDVLHEELAALKARSEYGRSRGLLSTSPTDITFGMVFDLLGYDRTMRSAVYSQFKSLSREVNQL